MCLPFWSTIHCKQRFHYPLLWSMKHRGPWQCDTPASSPASTDQRCQTSYRGRLAPAWPPMAWSTRFKSELLGAHVWLNTGDILTPQVRDRVSHNVRWRTVLLQSSLVAPPSVLRVHCDKIIIMPLVTLCSLYVPKIIKLYECIQLLQAKWQLAPLIWPTLYSRRCVKSASRHRWRE